MNRSVKRLGALCLGLGVLLLPALGFSAYGDRAEVKQQMEQKKYGETERGGYEDTGQAKIDPLDRGRGLGYTLLISRKVEENEFDNSVPILGAPGEKPRQKLVQRGIIIPEKNQALIDGEQTNSGFPGTGLMREKQVKVGEIVESKKKPVVLD